MKWMCTMPSALFKGVTKLDSSLGNTWAGNFLVSLLAKAGNGGSGDDVFVASKTRQHSVSQLIITENSKQKAGQERLDLDYRLNYERIEGITNETLAALYRDRPIDLTWFTADGEVFFGPESIRQILGDIQKSSWEIVIVPEASHADIYFRSQVWDKMYTDMTAAE